MPVIGAEPLQKNYYRLAVSMGAGVVDNIIISADGLYSLYFIREGRYFNATGSIPKIVMDYRNPQNSYMLFDYSCDGSGRRERVYFYQVQMLKDVTPNNAYRIAVEHGYTGTVEQWLQSLKGTPGKSAYELAVDCGFKGTLEEWLKSLKGRDGRDGRDGKDGKNAYELAVERGYTGSLEQWFAQFGDVTIIKNDVDEIKNTHTWVQGMG